MSINQKNVLSLEDGTHKIDRNLYIRVRGNSKLFVFRASMDGKRKDKGIGSAKSMSLAAAKSLADKMRAKIAQGIDVFSKETVSEKPHYFKDDALIVVEKIKEARRWKNPKSEHQWLATLETYVFPKIGDRLTDSITRDDIYEILSDIWETKNDTATKLRGRLENIFDYLSFMDIYSHPNPAKWQGGLSLLLPMSSKIHKVEHHEAPTIEELRQVSKKFINSFFPSHQAIMFGIMTVGRVNEFLYAKWDEIDFKENVWNCPRRKDGKDYPHRVPLPTQLIDMLKRIPRIDGIDLIFPSRNGAQMSIDTPRQILRKNLKRQVTMHGCRSTFRDWCAENGIDRVLAEKSLMHATGGAVEQAYQRSDLLEQRRPIMQAWADALLK